MRVTKRRESLVDRSGGSINGIIEFEIRVETWSGEGKERQGEAVGIATAQGPGSCILGVAISSYNGLWCAAADDGGRTCTGHAGDVNEWRQSARGKASRVEPLHATMRIKRSLGGCPSTLLTRHLLVVCCQVAVRLLASFVWATTPHP